MSRGVNKGMENLNDQNEIKYVNRIGKNLLEKISERAGGTFFLIYFDELGNPIEHKRAKNPAYSLALDGLVEKDLKRKEMLEEGEVAESLIAGEDQDF
jgi:hypothetical protein